MSYSPSEYSSTSQPDTEDHRQRAYEALSGERASFRLTSRPHPSNRYLFGGSRRTSHTSRDSSSHAYCPTQRSYQHSHSPRFPPCRYCERPYETAAPSRTIFEEEEVMYAAWNHEEPRPRGCGRSPSTINTAAPSMRSRLSRPFNQPAPHRARRQRTHYGTSSSADEEPLLNNMNIARQETRSHGDGSVRHQRATPRTGRGAYFDDSHGTRSTRDRDGRLQLDRSKARKKPAGSRSRDIGLPKWLRFFLT